MRLESTNGYFVDIMVTGYQFPGGRSTSEQVDWDANWLMVHGKVWDGSQTWEFGDPCMTTWEARELGSWLLRLESVDSAVVAAANPEDVQLWLTEPNLMFTLHDTLEGIITLDVYFDAESRPPTASNADKQELSRRVRLTMPQAGIAAAVSDWDKDLTHFPTR